MIEDRGSAVILLGPPGVGKGTQGALLAETFRWERIATGDLLRAARREGTDLGRKAQAFMDAGDLVPDPLMVALVRERMQHLPPDQGVVFDGFPRTVAQAEALSQALPDLGREVDAVLVLEAHDDILVQRISGRRSCPRCQQVYNVHFDPPLKRAVCDECEADLDHREDDRPETVRHRLKVYNDLTQPLIAYYEAGPQPVLRVGGDGSLEQVRAAVHTALTSLLGVEA